MKFLEDLFETFLGGSVNRVIYRDYIVNRLFFICCSLAFCSWENSHVREHGLFSLDNSVLLNGCSSTWVSSPILQLSVHPVLFEQWISTCYVLVQVINFQLNRSVYYALDSDIDQKAPLVTTNINTACREQWPIATTIFACVTSLVREKIKVSSSDCVADHLRTLAGWVTNLSAVIGYTRYFMTVGKWCPVQIHSHTHSFTVFPPFLAQLPTLFQYKSKLRTKVSKY